MQYADIDDGFSHGGVPRFYRGALRGLRRAVQAWRAKKVEFAMHLGDIVDGCFSPYPVPIFPGHSAVSMSPYGTSFCRQTF